MKTRYTAMLTLCLFAVIFCLLLVPAFAQDNKQALEKEKQRLAQDIDDLVQGLRSTKSCVSEAGTLEDLNKCNNHSTEKVRRFQKLQQELSEMGMTREQRKVQQSPRSY